MSGCAHSLSESNNGNTSENEGCAISNQNSFTYTENTMPGYCHGFDEQNPTIIHPNDGNDIGDSLAVFDEEIHKRIEYTEESRRRSEYVPHHRI